MENKKKLRWNYLVDKKFQMKYVMVTLVFMFLIGAMCGYVTYHTLWTQLGEKLALVYPQARLVSILNVVKIKLAIQLILLVPVVILVSVFLSHRVVGPISKIKKHMKKLIEKDFSNGLYLRKTDEFRDLAELINKSTDSIKQSLAKVKESVDKIISLSENAALQDNEKKALQQEIESLDNILSEFKIG
ncbi:methyl-accepting chemotaxis protein [bacterium]|nr:methyl-accepting chemotaxis protein [bacterium]